LARATKSAGPQRQLRARRGKAPTQAFGERLFAMCPDVQGILTVSARLTYHRSLVIFPKRLRKRHRLRPLFDSRQLAARRKPSRSRVSAFPLRLYTLPYASPATSLRSLCRQPWADLLGLHPRPQTPCASHCPVRQEDPRTPALLQTEAQALINRRGRGTHFSQRRKPGPGAPGKPASFSISTRQLASSYGPRTAIRYTQPPFDEARTRAGLSGQGDASR